MRGLVWLLQRVRLLGAEQRLQGMLTAPRPHFLATAEERQAVLLVLKEYPAEGENAETIRRVRDKLEPQLPSYDIPGARNFHVTCDVLVLIFLAVKEWALFRPRRHAGGRGGPRRR